MTIEDKIFAAVLAELDGLGRLAPLLARNDVEDIHFEGAGADDAAPHLG